jgi:hypothetical protein
VRRASNNQQTPWENTALEGQFYFKVLHRIHCEFPFTSAESSFSN